MKQNTCNKDLKEYAHSKNVCLWQIAEAVGIQDSGFSKRLRHELSADEKARYIAIIDKLAIAN